MAAENSDTKFNLTVYSSLFEPFNNSVWLESPHNGTSFSSGNLEENLVNALEKARLEDMPLDKLTICYVDSEGDMRFVRFRLDE